jgi:hypothetical protein
MPDTSTPDVMLGRAQDEPRFCQITGHRIPAFRDERYMALARTLAQPVQPAQMPEPAIMARLDAIADSVGPDAVAMVTLRSRGRAGGAACASVYPRGVGRDGATFAFADDVTEALDALAAALLVGVA